MKKTTKIAAIIMAMLLVLCSCGAEKEFSYSGALDENGFWKDLNTEEVIKLCDYSALEFSDEDFQNELNYWKAYYPSYEDSYDYEGVAEEGDRVHISFVGKIDGEEFDGGASEDSLIILGTTEMITGFVDDIYGHKIGDKFVITGTFPEEYGVEELNGKDAEFDAELLYFEVPSENYDDAWVSENFSSAYGWNDLEEMKKGILDELSLCKMVEASEIGAIPQSMIDHQKGALKTSYKAYADAYNVEIEEFLYNYVGIDDLDAYANEAAKTYAVYQAVAQKEGITITEDDIAAYFLDNIGSEDYSEYEEHFGLPYLKCMIMSEKAEKFIHENAKLR